MTEEINNKIEEIEAKEEEMIEKLLEDRDVPA